MPTNKAFGLIWLALSVVMFAFYAYTWVRRPPMPFALFVGGAALLIGLLRFFARARP